VRGAVAGADVVASTLHAGPGAVAAAADAGVPAVLFLHSYEPLCKYAFDAGARCDPASGCVGCPSSAALTPAERAELAGSRREHEQSLAAAAALVATSATVAAACEEWTGRRPVVAAGVAHEPAPVRADARGHVLLAAARWTPNKGSDLLEPLTDALRPRPLAVTEAGLGPELASRLAARPHVRVVPNAPIADLLDGAAVLLVPSQWSEPFGRVAFEGLAAGVPTLAAGVGGLTEFVPAEQLVIPADRPERWRDALESLAHPGAWEAARERGMAAARRVLATDPIGRIEAVLAQAAATGAPAAAGTVSALGDQS